MIMIPSLKKTNNHIQQKPSLSIVRQIPAIMVALVRMPLDRSDVTVSLDTMAQPVNMVQYLTKNKHLIQQ